MAAATIEVFDLVTDTTYVYATARDQVPDEPGALRVCASSNRPAQIEIENGSIVMIASLGGETEAAALCEAIRAAVKAHAG